MMRRRNAIPRNEREAEARERALATLAVMRRKGLALATAAKAERTSPKTVKRYVGSALRQKGLGERYRPTTYDRISRTLQVITPEGMQTVKVRDSRQATKLAEYWAAVQRYLETGDASALRKFHGKHITDANRANIPLLTNLHELDRLGSAGVLSFESLYARTV